MVAVRSAADIGSAIRSARKARGMTQADLGEIAGVHQPKVSEIERGKETAHLGIALRLLASLELTIEIGGKSATESTARPSATTAATVVFEEPLPDDTIDLDAIVGSKPKPAE